MEIKRESELDVDEISDLFRAWSQNLQICAMSGQKDDLKRKAIDCLALMTRMATRLSG